MRLNRFTVALRCTAIALAGLQAWIHRHAMNPDGISYLDLGDAFYRGDFDTAVNAYWSPFYPWFLGTVLGVLRPSANWEFTVVHFVNFSIFMACLMAFEFFLRQLLASRRTTHSAASDSLPDWMLVGFLYSLFIWSSCYLIGVTVVTPDLCVATIVYLAAGLIVRFRQREPGVLASVGFRGDPRRRLSGEGGTVAPRLRVFVDRSVRPDAEAAGIHARGRVGGGLRFDRQRFCRRRCPRSTNGSPSATPRN